MTKYWHFVVCTHSVASFIVPCLPFPASKQPWTNYRLQFYWVNYLSCWTNKTNGLVFTLSIICDENVARLSTNNWTYNNAISYLYLLLLANVYKRKKKYKRKMMKTSSCHVTRYSTTTTAIIWSFEIFWRFMVLIL